MRHTLDRRGGCLPIDLAWRQVTFSLAEAKRALPYVARIARDAAEAYRHASSCRAALEDRLPGPHRHLLLERRDHALRTLNTTIDECNAVGADLLNIPMGVVRFNALVEGRQVSLIWRIEEPVESAWQELIQSVSNPESNVPGPETTEGRRHVEASRAACDAERLLTRQSAIGRR